MNDNTVQDAVINTDRIQHNLEVRKSGMKYWLREQKQGFNQFCIDQEATHRVRSDFSYPLCSLDEDRDVEQFKQSLKGNSNTTYDTKIEHGAITTWMCAIASRPETLPEVLRHLSANASEDVRLAVARNESTTRDILMTLAADNSVRVRYAVAENPTLPVGILDLLIEDANPAVSGRARRSLDKLVPGSARSTWHKLKTLAQEGIVDAEAD